MNTKKFSTRDIAHIALFAVVIAVCSWISIPMAVPFTLQTFGVFMAVAVLGGRKGTFSVLVYILLAAAGVPVLAGFGGGLGRLLGNTGGYVMGFLLSALIMWGMEAMFGRSLKVLAISMVLGLLACYAAGTVWFIHVYSQANGPVGIMTVLSWCVFPFIVPDLLKISLALVLAPQIRRYAVNSR